jgi:hypothetical protein
MGAPPTLAIATHRPSLLDAFAFSGGARLVEVGGPRRHAVAVHQGRNSWRRGRVRVYGGLWERKRGGGTPRGGLGEVMILSGAISSAAVWFCLLLYSRLVAWGLLANQE